MAKLLGNDDIYLYILVGGAITILKNMSSSMGRMTSHIIYIWLVVSTPLKNDGVRQLG